MSSEAVERKLAAILSADVVGYSRLMAEDEAGTIRTLGAYRDEIRLLVDQHRGRIADFTGDNFLAEFPTALDAVECAVEMQRVLKARNAGLPEGRQMEFRIGVHLGDVAVEDERLYGDGVNIAARLEGLAEPGGICISAAVHEQVRSGLDIEFANLGLQALKNIAEPVGTFAVRLEGRAARRASRPGRRRLLVAAAILLAVGLALWASWPRIVGMGLEASLLPGNRPALPDKPSIVVLPFDNMSGDAGQEYFADGLTEDITNALSGTSSLFVIARNSAFTYKGKSVQVTEIGQQLGVRYVLEGSVRRAGDQIRVTAQLVEATNGFHVWSGQYDRGLKNIFEVQSEIAERILGAVGANITEAELERIRDTPTRSITAYDAFARSRAQFNLFTKKGIAEARRWAERAVELDPEYAEAISFLGSTHSMPYLQLWSNNKEVLDSARILIERATALDSGIPDPYLALGVLKLATGEPEAVLALARRAEELAPSDFLPKLFMGIALAQTGRFLESMQFVRQAMRLNPRLEATSMGANILGGMYANLGQMDAAVVQWERARENPDLVDARLKLIEFYARSGDTHEVSQLVDEVLRVNPELTWTRIRGGVAATVRSSAEQKRIFLAAGIPE